MFLHILADLVSRCFCFWYVAKVKLATGVQTRPNMNRPSPQAFASRRCRSRSYQVQSSVLVHSAYSDLVERNREP